MFEKQKTEDEQLEESDTGYRNADLILSDKELLDNIHKIQDRNFIIRSEKKEFLKVSNIPKITLCSVMEKKSATLSIIAKD